MGLDMYLKGDKFSASQVRVQVDGFDRTSEILQLGYWRKHPNLHGFIVNTFANGVDECQSIHLSADDLSTIIEAINEDKLVDTAGFFFGTSPTEGDEYYDEVKESSIVTFTRARTWLNAGTHDDWRSVEYQASW